MTQSNAKVNGLAILQDMLQLLASTHQLADVVPPIMETALTLCDAHAGCYLIFDNPAILIAHRLDDDQVPDIDTLYELATSLEDDLSLSPNLPAPLNTHYAGWLLAPVRNGANTLALLVLLFDQPTSIADENAQLLLALINGLCVVTRSDRTIARHKMLARNQNEFVRITTHDLRSPLTYMRGFASMLESDKFGDLNEKQAHFIDKILTGVDQMESLVENIQDAGRFDPETGFYEMERKPTDLIDMVNRIADSHLMPAEKQELSLNVENDEALPIINVDQTMIERAVTNLVDNAIKYTPNGGQITVKVQREENDVVIRVSDTGYGISEDNLKKLFQRHFRIHRREHARVKGSGLGLFIVRSVAIRHGGTAWVESMEGNGSTFAIRIPLTGENIIGSR